MSVVVAELYRALVKAGVDDELAQAAAKAVVAADTRTDLATKADLAEALHKQTLWMVSAMVVLTGIYAGIATAIKLWVR